MAGVLSNKKRSRLLSLFREMFARSLDHGDEAVFRASLNGKLIELDIEGYRLLEKVVQLLHDVQEWKEAYPEDALINRVIRSLSNHRTFEEAADELITALSADCKEFVAYPAIFGFNLTDGVSISFGPYHLASLGEDGLEVKVIGRVKQHADHLGEPLRTSEPERFRKLLEKHKNVPVLEVRYHGSKDMAESFVGPIAERVAEFMQAAIGILTDQNDHIIDYQGRFTGEFQVTMPVLTVNYDEMSFPNVRGFPYRPALTADNLERLDRLGVLALAERFVAATWTPNNATDTLLCRALSCFSDGERGVTDGAKIVSFVSAIEALVSRRDNAAELYAIGAAVLCESEHETDESIYEFAKVIYDKRSRAVHDGIRPNLAYSARTLAKRAILRVLQLREEYPTRKAIRKMLKEEANKRCFNWPGSVGSEGGALDK